MLFSRRHPVRDDELNAYIDGELAVAARARVEAHLETCAACRETVSSLRSLRGALGALPREERQRSFVVREADVLPNTTARPAGGYAPAARLLSGVTVMAVLAFAALVSLDAAGGSRSKHSGSPSSLLASQQDSSGQPEARDNVSSTLPTTVEREQPTTALPATGPLPEVTGDAESPPNDAVPVPEATGDAESPPNDAVPVPEATQDTEQPPSGPFPKPTAVPQDQPGASESTPSTEANTSTQATTPPFAGVEKPTEQPAGRLPSGTPVESEQPEGEKTLAFASGIATEPPPTAYDRTGQFILPPAVPTAEQKGLAVEADQSGGSDTGLRIGEGAAAAVALLAGGSLAFVWWRRRPL